MASAWSSIGPGPTASEPARRAAAAEPVTGARGRRRAGRRGGRSVRRRRSTIRSPSSGRAGRPRAAPVNGEPRSFDGRRPRMTAAARPILSRSPVRNGTNPTRNAAPGSPPSSASCATPAGVDHAPCRARSRAGPGPATAGVSPTRRARHRGGHREGQQVAAGRPEQCRQPRRCRRRRRAGPSRPRRGRAPAPTPPARRRGARPRRAPPAAAASSAPGSAAPAPTTCADARPRRGPPTATANARAAAAPTLPPAPAAPACLPFAHQSSSTLSATALPPPRHRVARPVAPPRSRRA